MNLIESIRTNSGVELNEEDRTILMLEEDFNTFGVDETLDLYESLFLLEKPKFKFLLEDAEAEVDRRMRMMYGSNWKSKAESDPKLQRIAASFKEKIDLASPTTPSTKTIETGMAAEKPASSLKKGIETASELPARSPAVEMTKLPPVNQEAFTKAAETFKPTINLEDVPKESQAKFVEAVKSGNLESMSAVAKDIVPKDAAQAAQGATKVAASAGAAKAVAQPTSFLGKIWAGVKSFFAGGWKGITDAFKTGNYGALLHIPLVQVGLAVGGTALAFKIIKAIRNRAGKRK